MRDPLGFDRLVDDALRSLPPRVLAHLEGIEVHVVETPPTAPLGTSHAAVALASYQTVRTGPRRAPRRGGRLTLYRRPLEARSRTRPELIALVQQVVVHELAHHLGLDDDGLDGLGWS